MFATTRLLAGLSLAAGLPVRPAALRATTAAAAALPAGLALAARTRPALALPSLADGRAVPSAGLRIRIPKAKRPLKRGRGKQVLRAKPGASFKPKSKKYYAPEHVKLKPHKGLMKRIRILKDDNGRIVFKRWHNYTTSHNYGLSRGRRMRLRKPAYIKSGAQNKLFRKLLGLPL